MHARKHALSLSLSLSLSPLSLSLTYTHTHTRTHTHSHSFSKLTVDIAVVWPGFTFIKHFHGTVPQSLSELIPLYNLTHTLRSSSQSCLSVPAIMTIPVQEMLWCTLLQVCCSSALEQPPSKNTQSHLSCQSPAEDASFYSVLTRSSFSHSPAPRAHRLWSF